VSDFTLAQLRGDRRTNQSADCPLGAGPPLMKPSQSGRDPEQIAQIGAATSILGRSDQLLAVSPTAGIGASSSFPLAPAEVG
jgi:hypothetical protein